MNDLVKDLKDEATKLVIEESDVDSEILELLEIAEIDLSKDIPSPPPVLYQKDKVMLSKGDFSVVVGAAKSRKTFFLTAIAGAYLCEDEYINMHSGNDAGNVLWIDTEQSVYHACNVARRVHRIASMPIKQNDPRFKMFCFREHEPEKRKLLTEQAILTYKPSLVIVDGAADLVLDVNDSAESCRLATLFMDLTKKLNIHIITALHCNPGSDKPRGHLGTNFLNKAHSIFLVRANGDTSTVSVERCRDIAIDDFAFFVDSNGLPQATDIPVKSAKEDRLKSIFSAFTNPISYSELKSAIMASEDIKETASKNKIKEALLKNILFKNTAGMYYVKKNDPLDATLPF